jgi:hypothetical protein
MLEWFIPYIYVITLPAFRWRGTNIDVYLDLFAFIFIPTSLLAFVLFLLIFMFSGNKCLSSEQAGSRIEFISSPSRLLCRLSLPSIHLISTYMNLAWKLFTFHTEVIFLKLKTRTLREEGVCDLTNVLISSIESCYLAVPWESPYKDRMTSSYVSLLPLHLIYMQGHPLYCETCE